LLSQFSSILNRILHKSYLYRSFSFWFTSSILSSLNLNWIKKQIKEINCFGVLKAIIHDSISNIPWIVHPLNFDFNLALDWLSELISYLLHRFFMLWSFRYSQSFWAGSFYFFSIQNLNWWMPGIMTLYSKCFSTKSFSYASLIICMHKSISLINVSYTALLHLR